MKKVIALAVALMFVLSVSAVSFAADKPAAAPAAPAKAEEKKAAPATPAAPAAPAKAEEKKAAPAAAPAKKAEKKEITGDVTAVDAKANTITVKSKKAEAVIALNDKTTFEPKGKSKADVTAGAKVHVKYAVADGKNTALKVVVKKAAPAKADEKKAAPAAPAAPAKAEEKKPAPAAAPATPAAPAAPAKK